MPVEAVHKILVTGTVVSSVRNPLTSTRRRLCMLRRRCEIVADHWRRHSAEPEHPADPRLTIEQALDAQNLPAPIPGTVDYLIDGENFFRELHRSVEGATEYVDTQIFLFDNDDVAASYADLLRKKSGSVPCRVLLDQLGTVICWWIDPNTEVREGYQPPASMTHYLRRGSDVEVRMSYNPGLVTDHTKLIVIDGEEAYLGGMNIGREYLDDRHDMMVRVRGPAVTALQNEFNHAWRLQGGWGDWGIRFHKAPLQYRKTPGTGELAIRILKTGPCEEDINKALVTAIRASRKRIYLHVSYITSDHLVRELIKARGRGVEITMILPAKSDTELLNNNNHAAAGDLLGAGAKAYLYPRASHMKAVVVDDWVCLGSANLDALSLFINEELNIAFSDKSSAEKLIRDLFEEDIRISKQLDTNHLEDWDGSFLEFIVDQM